MRLSELHTGEKGVIVKVMGRGAFRKRIIEMGFIRGKEVVVVQNAPLKDPIHYKVMGYDVSLRRNDAALIEVISEAEFEKEYNQSGLSPRSADSYLLPSGEELQAMALHKGKTINVALVGNPNCGKTSLFNYASGAHEHVGNYSGVTVDAKEGVFHQNGYTFRIVDLPGTYSLSAYTPEELYVRKHLNEAHPDVVINVIDASNLERNLYLTTQLIDMDQRMVIALNMYDEMQRQGNKFDYESLARMIGAPIIPTISRTGFGIEDLFNRVIKVYEEQDPVIRHIHINYGESLEKGISNLRQTLHNNEQIGKSVSKRYLSIKLLEGDSEIESFVRNTLPNAEAIMQERDRNKALIETLLQEDCETAFTDARYGFISGALRETFEQNKIKEATSTQIIDLFVTHKVLGFPIFILFMWIMFETTFRIGNYPQEWIDSLVKIFGSFMRSHMAEGPLKDLIVDGIIGGVGGVIVFLPNILILYAFISFMEDSGYMARAAFIMDKIMHKMGLHGKSFIPLVMGFGCNVPAIMASRTIESRNSRMITMLVNPLMSCSARLPVYVLLTSAFFPQNASLVLLGLYVTGILLAVVMARLFKRFLFKEEDVPFVMELPPYRMPTAKSILLHMWEKSKQYLHKMGGVILVASIIIWFLGYFPRETVNSELFDKQIAEIEQSDLTPNEKESAIAEQERLKAIDHQRNSYIGKIGQTIQPVLAPLGFDWRISVSLVTGMAAKEVVVSTLSVLHTGKDDNNLALSERLKEDRDADGNPTFTPLIALSLMLFVLLYFPCIATISAIINESHSWKWGLFVITYTCLLAWIVSFVVYQTGSLVTGIIH